MLIADIFIISEDGEESKEKLAEAVLLISPNIIATDKTEAFLSHIVSAGK